MLFSSGWVALKRSWMMRPMTTNEFQYSLKFQVLINVSVAYLRD